MIFDENLLFLVQLLFIVNTEKARFASAPEDSVIRPILYCVGGFRGTSLPSTGLFFNQFHIFRYKVQRIFSEPIIWAVIVRLQFFLIPESVYKLTYNS